MSKLAEQWLELESVFAPAALREQHIDLRKNVDWDTIDHFIRIGALATACAMIEDAGLKNGNEHVKIIFELRNAVIHNACDIALNRNKNALTDAQSYLATSKHLQLSHNLNKPFFSLTGSKIQLEPNLYFALRLCMQ